MLLDRLLKMPPMIRGSFSHVSTRCGKHNCWCAKSSKGHKHMRLTWSEQGSATTRKVPVDQANRVKELTKNYRQYRQQQQELIRLQQQIQKAITQLETSVIETTRKPLLFLNYTTKKATSVATSRRKTRSGRKSQND